MAYTPVNTVQNLGIKSLWDYAQENQGTPNQEMPNAGNQNIQTQGDGDIKTQGDETKWITQGGGSGEDPPQDMMSFEESGLDDLNYGYYQDWFNDPHGQEDFENLEDYLSFRKIYG